MTKHELKQSLIYHRLEHCYKGIKSETEELKRKTLASMS